MNESNLLVGAGRHKVSLDGNIRHHIEAVFTKLTLFIRTQNVRLETRLAEFRDSGERLESPVTGILLFGWQTRISPGGIDLFLRFEIFKESWFAVSLNDPANGVKFRTGATVRVDFQFGIIFGILRFKLLVIFIQQKRSGFRWLDQFMLEIGDLVLVGVDFEWDFADFVDQIVDFLGFCR